MSNLSLQSRHGAQIAFQGPFGNFILHPPARDTVSLRPDRDCALALHVALAVGRAGSPSERQFWLLFGARREQDIYYREEFETLAAKHANFQFSTYSEPS